MSTTTEREHGQNREHSHRQENEHQDGEHHSDTHHDTDRHVSRMTRFLQPRLLLILAQRKQSYGYELMEQLGDTDFGSASLDTGTLYKTLRSMEKERLVTSEWNTEGTGPAKRVYCITDEGRDVLRSWYVSIRQAKQAIERFLEACDTYFASVE